MKKVGKIICNMLGFYKSPRYIEAHLKEADLHSARNLSVIIALLEIWMIVRNAVKYRAKFTTIQAYFSFTWGYYVLLLSSVFVCAYSALYLSGKLTAPLKKCARTFIFLYFIIGIYFGIVTTLSDIARGRNITCFLAMCLMVSLIVVWRPYISIVLTAIIAQLFVVLVNHYSHETLGRAWYMNEAELINFATFMISLVAVAINMYSQRHRDATNAYNLKKAHEREVELMRKESEHLGKLFMETASALVSAIDAKDRYTHGHSTRVAEYSSSIALKAGMSSEDLRDIYFSALLHDVGKIGVSEEIINKTTKLTNEEYNEIKKHTVLGWEILSNITHSASLSVGAHFHHERWDGKGYPEGLKGESIPEYARIIAVADAYDTMTSRRSYRDVLPQSVVRAEIEKGSGSQFDPKYAKIMLEIIDNDKNYTLKEGFSVIH